MYSGLHNICTLDLGRLDGINCTEVVLSHVNPSFRPSMNRRIMTISLKDDGKKGAFFIQADEEIQAEMTFVWAGEKKIIIDHTEVSEQLRGQQAGKKLVQKAVDFAREQQIKILPLCPFAKRVMEANADYADVL